MKVAKIKEKKNKETKKVEETYCLKNMLKILLYIITVLVVFYLITNLIVNNRKTEPENNVTVVDFSKITLSQLLSREEEEYFVIATKASLYNSSYVDANYINLYNEYINNYKQKEDSYAFYYVDLDNALNKNYFGEKLNITEDLSKLQLNDEVLFKIKSGSIEKTYVGREKILDKLSRL